MKLFVDTVVGNSTESRWSQVGRYGGYGGESELFVVVDIVSSGILELPSFGSALLESLREQYLLTKPNNLEGLKELLNIVLSDVEEGVEMSVMVGLISGEYLYVVGRGGVKVMVYREGLHEIFVGGEELASVSGVVQPKDGVIFGTSDFCNNVLVDLFEDEEIYERDGLVTEMMAPKVHGLEDSSGVAGLVVRVVDFMEKQAGSVGAKVVLESVSDGGMGRLQSIAAKLRRREGGLFVAWKEDKVKSSRLAWILIMLLTVSVAIGAYKRSSVLRTRKYVELEQNVNQSLEEIVAVADLNPERAKYLLSKTRSQVNEYLEAEEDEKYLEKARDFLIEIDKVEERALRKSEAEANVFVDLNIMKNGINPGGYYLDEEGNILVYDKASKQVYGMNLSDKSSFVVGGDMGEVKDISYFDGKVFALSELGVVSKKIDGGEVVVEIEPDDLWSEVSYIDMYAGNIYLLDTGAGEIWKYPVLDDGYGARRRWLGKGIVLDLSKVIDMRVSGDIWILTSSGKLERYSRGVPVEFSMEGFPAANGDGLSNPSAFYVTDEEVYVIERGEGRLIVFGEDGVYRRQFVADELRAGDDLVAYEGMVYVLSADEIFSFPLGD